MKISWDAGKWIFGLALDKVNSPIGISQYELGAALTQPQHLSTIETQEVVLKD